MTKRHLHLDSGTAAHAGAPTEGACHGILRRRAADAARGSEEVLRLLDLAGLAQSDHCDVVSCGTGTDVPDAPPTYRVEDPAEIAAVVLLGRALATVPLLLDRIMESCPVLVMECRSPAWIDPVADALERCFGSRVVETKPVQSGMCSKIRPDATIVRSKTGRKRGGDQERDKRVDRAFNAYRPLIGVVAPERMGLPEEFERACDGRVVLGPLEPDDLALIAAYAVGIPPSATVSVSTAAQVDPMDLRIALHPARSADEAMKRLGQLVERRTRSLVVEATPQLSDLRGYGAAADWGLAAAEDLAAYARGDLPWSECDPGALLSGPPGTGKTFFASALARQANVTLLTGSLAQWQSEGEAHLGTTLKAMRAFFGEARDTAPCVALIDELDSFGTRYRSSEHNRHYAAQIINGLLECLDGEGGRPGVLLVGTTNHADQIDPAILRSGRFDRILFIDLPSVVDRAAILRHHLGTALPDADLLGIARLMVDATGADCAAWVRRARARARRARRDVDEADLKGEITDVISPRCAEDDRRVAVHESGHAVVARAIGIPVEFVVLRSLGDEGAGHTRLRTKSVLTPNASRDMLTTLMAGRAAEIMVFGSPSSGAASDLAAATSLIRDMLFRWGMGPRLEAVGPAMTSEEHGHVEHELRTALRRAQVLLQARRQQLDCIAENLLQRRFLCASEVDELMH